MTNAPRSFRHTPIGRFLYAPIEPRSYANLLFLGLAFPLGLLYFVFLIVGLSLGFGLLIIWIGVPVLALVMAGSWLFASMERQLAIHLLGAKVPPMAPQPASPAAPAGSLWRPLTAFLANPVTWKGMGYLAIKFPLGLATFVVAVTLGSLSLAFLLAPVAYNWVPLDVSFSWNGPVRVIDTLGEALLCSLFGVALTLVSLNLFNALASGWGKLASALLGSPRFTAPGSVPTPAVV